MTTAQLDLTSQVALGNVFVTSTTDQVALNVGTAVTVSGTGALPFYNNSGVALAWNVTDFFGAVRAQGTVERLPSGSARTAVRPFGLSTRPPAGYFVLNLRLVDRNHSNALLQSNFTTFAVLWPVQKPLGVRYGVGEHYGQGFNQASMQLLAKAGLGTVRDSNGWSANEPTTRGVYDWSRSDGWMVKLNQSGIDPLYILAYGNDLYDWWTGGGCGGNTEGDTMPYTQDGLDGFANYAKALVQHFGTNLTSIEVWNEVYTSFWCGPPNVTANFSVWYTNVAKAVYPAVKSVRPDVKVLGGAVASVAPGWFESLFKLGAINYMDVLSVHPYYVLPENVEASLPELQAIATKYSAVTKEIWATEYGWSTSNERARYSVAKYLVRQTLAQGLYGVTRHYWYDAVDDAWDSFGLLKNTAYRGPLVPNPAFVAYANLARLLNAATFQKRVNPELGRRAYVLLFKSPTYGQVRALWTTLPYDNVLYLRASKPLTLFDIQGGNTTLTPDASGAVRVTLTDTPQFLVGGTTTMESWGDSPYAPLADNVYDYAEVLGNNGWYYGRFVTPLVGAPASAYNQSAWSRLWLNRNLWSTWWLQYASISATSVAPSVDTSSGTPLINWAVLRYKANATIPNASLAGYLVLGDQDEGSDGVEVRVYVNGAVKWQKTLVPADHHFFPTTFLVKGINLVQGLNVDFVVTPGPGTNKVSDGVTAYITVGVPRDASQRPAWVIASQTSGNDASGASSGLGRSLVRAVCDYATKRA